MIFRFYMAGLLLMGNLFAEDQLIETYLDAITQQKQQINELKDRVDELEDSLESVETRTLVDKINFGVGFNTEVNSYEKKYADGHKHTSSNLYTTKLMLNMESKITKNMRFTGRLSMYKYWADSTKHMYSQFDNMQGRAPSDSTLFVERAYVDWKFTGDKALFPSVLTIGRQPSSDGPSHQFKSNTTRKSTYSALVFDGASDGIVLTTSLEKVLLLKNARIRFAYGKGFQNDETSQNVTNAFIGADNSLKDTDVYGLFFESALFNRSNTLFQIGVAQMKNIIANPLDSNSSENKNIGDVTFAGVMFEGTDINKMGLDLFAHFAYSYAKPSHDVYSYNGQSMSLLGDGSDFESKSATAFWLGTRYAVSEFSKVGVEYNQGSRYWLTASQGSYDLLNKLSTRGKAVETYYLYAINRYSFLRFGGVYVDYDYTNSGWFLSEPKKFEDLSSTEKQSSVESVKNIYLQFGLNF